MSEPEKASDQSKGQGHQLWVKSGEKVAGPFTANQLRELASGGKLLPTHLISKDQSTWSAAKDVKGLEFRQSVPKRQPGKAEDAGNNETEAKRSRLPTITEGISEAPRPVTVASLIWIIYGVLQMLNSLLILGIAGLLLIARLRAKGNEGFALENLTLIAAISGIIAFGIGGGFVENALSTLRAKPKHTRSVGVVSIVVGVLPILIFVGLVIAVDFSDAPTGIWFLFMLMMALPVVLVIAGILVLGQDQPYGEWRSKCWEGIPDDAPERLAVENPMRYRREHRKEQRRKRLDWAVGVLSKIPPFHLLPEVLQRIVVQLTAAGVMIMIGLVVVIGGGLLAVAIMSANR